MNRSRATHALVLTAALLIGAGPYLVRAAGARQDAPTTGRANLDMARVLAESEARRTATEKMMAFARKVADTFDEISALPHLTNAEIEQYAEAAVAEKPTAAQTARIAELKAESARRVQELATLTTKKGDELTAADRARLRTLTELQQGRATAMDGLRRIFQGLVQQEDARRTREAAQQVREIVVRVARDERIAEVFDAAAMPVATVDLTPQVLQRVRAK